jgi:hypothetical protein
MKHLVILVVLGAGGYGLYQLLNTVTPAVDAANPANQLRQGQAAEAAARAKMGEAAVATVQQAVNGFRDLNGRFPASLQELVDKKLIDGIPPGLAYDPATGVVSSGG